MRRTLNNFKPGIFDLLSFNYSNFLIKSAMRCFLISALCFFFFTPEWLQGQGFDTTFTPAEPIGGIERLSLRYYDIEFTPAQRTLLVGVDVEMIFLVSDEGVASIQSVNGVRNLAIIDSLYTRDAVLPGLQPQMQGGIPKQSLYFMNVFGYEHCGIKYHKTFSLPICLLWLIYIQFSTKTRLT